MVYELKHPFKNGTTQLVFEPLEILAKLAALVPRPRANLTRYHGVLATGSRSRPACCPTFLGRVTQAATGTTQATTEKSHRIHDF